SYHVRMTASERGAESDDSPPPAASRAPLGLHRPAWRLVFALALPALAQHYLLLLVRLSDNYLAGNLDISDTELLKRYQSAMTTAGYLYWFVSSYTILVSVGSTALVARFIGAGDHAGADHAVGQSVLLGGVLGVVGAAGALAGLPSLIAALQLTGE